MPPSSDYQSLPRLLPLNVLVVGFTETELDPSCHSALVSLEPNPSLEWVTTVQEARAKMAIGDSYDVIVFNCREEGDEWGQAWQMLGEEKDALILGITKIIDCEEAQCPVAEDVLGFRVDEVIAPTVLKLGLHQAQERKQLIAEQKRLCQQLGEAAYKNEMADVASTVLHNVGNVLTSVSVAANMVEAVVDQSSVTLVNRISELIKTHEADLGKYLTEDPKGKRIPPSLEKLGGHLIEEQQTILKEMKGLVRNICHMKEIIASHQTMAKSVGQVEYVALVDVLSHAMELSFQPGDAKWIAIHRDYQDVPAVLVDHHQLLQILVNLLRNAKQAMRQQARDHHDLKLRVNYQSGDEAYVVMTIQDSGIGIAPEHLSKMFTRGFTTKQDGNGIGLHSSIKAIQNMGGEMHVLSEGVGEGAIFTLTFPVQKEVVLP